MQDIERLEKEAILSGDSTRIDSPVQQSLAASPLDCVETKYPHYQYAIESPDDVGDPDEDHPVFYGCFDWHSSVHGYWALVRQLRVFEAHPQRSEIIETIERRLTEENVEREAEYFEENPAFEKPYGWAWLLRLAAELSLWEDSIADTWERRLKPLENTIRSLVETEFLTQNRPFRVGTHENSAFALAAIIDYARTTENRDLETAAAATARRFYADDTAYPVEFEPLGWDFLSPALTEADLMRRVLGGEEFTEWLDQFLPELTRQPYRAVLDPVEVEPAPDEEVSTHLKGLNISKAWCLLGIAAERPEHRYSERFEESAWRHIDSTLAAAVTDDYASSHWLSSFVLYLLTRNSGGIADRAGTGESG